MGGSSEEVVRSGGGVSGGERWAIPFFTDRSRNHSCSLRPLEGSSAPQTLWGLTESSPESRLSSERVSAVGG